MFLDDAELATQCVGPNHLDLTDVKQVKRLDFYVIFINLKYLIWVLLPCIVVDIPKQNFMFF